MLSNKTERALGLALTLFTLLTLRASPGFAYYQLGAFWRSGEARVTITLPMQDGAKVGALDASTFWVGGTCLNGQNVTVSGSASGSVPCTAGAWSLSLDLSGLPDETVTITASQLGAVPASRWLVKESTFCANPANSGASPFAGGDGTAPNPYLICTQAQLAQVRNYLDKAFALKNHVDLSGSPNTFAPLSGDRAGTDWANSPKFSGIFDGGDFEIRHFRYDAFPTHTAVGLFGLTDGATFRRLGMPDVDVAGAQLLGGMFGKIWHNSLIEDCWVTGAVLVGSPGGYEFGLLGGGASGSLGYDGNVIRRSYAIGTIDNTVGNPEVGGLIGWMSSSTIEDSWARVSITGAGGGDEVAGLIGGVSSELTKPSFIKRCHAEGVVPGTGGGLVGEDNDGYMTVYSSYWDTQASGQSSSIGGTGKTSAEMATQATFTDWDFAGTWAMPITLGLASGPPVLRKSNGCTGTETTYHDRGTGTSANPYLLCTQAQLLDLMASPTAWSMAFKLTADIDLTGKNQTNGITPIGRVDTERPFSGVFDGAGYAISNYTYSSAAQNFGSGLFGYVQGPGVIKNLEVSSVNLTDSGEASYTGPLVGLLELGALVDHCYTTGTLAAPVTDYSSEGGLVGLADTGSLISSSYSQVSITVPAVDWVEIGGLVGTLEQARVRDSYAKGTVSCTAPAAAACAGLVGWIGATHFSEVSRSYAAGNVTGGAVCAGGLFGGTDSAINPNNSFATGNVSGTFNTWPNVGPLIGCGVGDFNSSSTYFSSTAAIVNNGPGGTNSAGLSANTSADPNYFTKPLLAPQSAWDFSVVWRDNSGTNTLPTLRPNAEAPDCIGIGPTYNARGKGTPGDPYLLCTPAQLLSLMVSVTDLDKAYRLGKDIDLVGLDEGDGVHPIGAASAARPYTGIFDGAGYSIKNMTYTGGANSLGLFSALGGGAIVRNLTMENVLLTTTDGSDAGAIAGNIHADGAFITHCSASGTVSSSTLGSWMGGLVGSTYGGNPVTIHRSLSSVTVQNPVSDSSGGLIGGCDPFSNSTCIVTDSAATGSITALSGAGGLIGGPNGNGNTIVIRNSYFSGSLTAQRNSASGGLIASAKGTVEIEHSFVTGSVTCTGTDAGAGACGNLVGNVFSGLTITDSYYSSLATNPGGTTNNSLAGSQSKALSGFYDPANAPFTSWNFDTFWQGHLSTSALPTLR